MLKLRPAWPPRPTLRNGPEDNLLPVLDNRFLGGFARPRQAVARLQTAAAGTSDHVSPLSRRNTEKGVFSASSPALGSVQENATSAARG